MRHFIFRLCHSTMILPAAGGLGICVLAMAVFGQRGQRNPHGVPRQCRSCHGADPPEGVQAPDETKVPAGQVKYPLSLSDESEVCGNCHKLGQQQSHPIGMAPSIPIPAGWPLSREGRLTCNTCHEPHRAASASAADAADHLLRSPARGQAFCEQCHRSLSQSDKRAWHILAEETAHSNSPGPSSSYKWVLDQISLRCLTCHDGTGASDISIQPGAETPSIMPESSHPIGVEYPPRSASAPGLGARSKYRSPQLLDPRIRLFDGKLGCGTCHNPYSKYPFFLVLRPGGGRLCLSCHIK